MQFPKANNDLLIFAPSIIRIPVLLVFEALSEPAKSISESLEMLVLDYSLGIWRICWHWTCNIACDLDEV